MVQGDVLEIWEVQMKHLGLAVVSVTMIVLAGCESAQTAFDRARQTDSVQGYRQFIERYPNSAYTEEARQRSAELEAEFLAQEATRIAEGRKADELAMARLRSYQVGVTTLSDVFKDFPQDKPGQIQYMYFAARQKREGGESFKEMQRTLQGIETRMQDSSGAPVGDPETIIKIGLIPQQKAIAVLRFSGATDEEGWDVLDDIQILEE